MKFNAWFRQAHRWLAIAFTLGVVVNFIALSGGEEPAFWVYLLALIPLFMLLFTGLYLFALPYGLKWRGARRVGEKG
ncbi:hypothetical protein [Pelagibacterium sp.]|uniref:hypothetical protein n=1 Tax=Pelagibacterium sp. TaxID=1967288 RepID=UPI003A8D648A